jgi:hypothetical protein
MTNFSGEMLVDAGGGVAMVSKSVSFSSLW